MMPDYMEALVSQLGLRKVLCDLRLVVEQMANNCTDKDEAAKYWWLEEDLSCSIQDFPEDE